MRCSDDLLRVWPEHEEIHQRLANWGAWSRPGWQRQVSPLFRHYRPPGYISLSPRTTVDPIDAWRVQRLIPALDPARRLVLAWWYIHPWRSPWAVARRVEARPERLASLVHSARHRLSRMANE